jgi:transposase
MGIQENGYNYYINVETVHPPTLCQHCLSSNLVGFGRRKQMIKDLPMYEHRVSLHINTRRYLCHNCCKTFYEVLPEIDQKRLMTKRLVQWIGKQSTKQTFASIAEKVGCTEFTVRATFHDYVSELEKTICFEVPKWIGIDQIHLIKPRCVIINIQNNTIIELLPNRDKNTLASFLNHLENKEHIQYAVMDMWEPYRDAVQAVIPQAKIVVDKFHVVRMANTAMEHVRKNLRESLTQKQRRVLTFDRSVLLKRKSNLNDKELSNLNVWVKNYPQLGQAYRLKEQFFDIYDAKSPDEAQIKFTQWQKSIQPEIADAFANVEQTWCNWTIPILQYFNHPVANIYSESFNSLIQVINRLKRGYSFDALRIKILFADDINFDAYDSLTRIASNPCIQKLTNLKKPEKNYGVDISMLIRMLKNSEL